MKKKIILGIFFLFIIFSFFIFFYFKSSSEKNLIKTELIESVEEESIEIAKAVSNNDVVTQALENVKTQCVFLDHKA